MTTSTDIAGSVGTNAKCDAKPVYGEASIDDAHGVRSGERSDPGANGAIRVQPYFLLG